MYGENIDLPFTSEPCVTPQGGSDKVLGEYMWDFGGKEWHWDMALL